MKKRVLIFFILATFVLLSGAEVFIGSGEALILSGEEEVLSKSYKIKARTAIEVFFKYGNDYYDFYLDNLERADVKDFSCINNQLKKDISELFLSIEYSPVDSSMSFDKSGFTYTEGKNGVGIDREAFASDFYKNFNKGQTELLLHDRPYETSVERLKELSLKRSGFFTAYATSNANRKHNIKQAASKLDGITVPAGEALSFNDAVGYRTYENGYLDAKVIQNGVFTEGVGGGVCQVSTTLYNAWLKAGLGIQYQLNHSLPVSYVDPSFDAMVSEYNDLILKNDSPHDVFISANADGQRLSFTVYGEGLKEKVVLKSKILRTVPYDEYDVIKQTVEWQENETERIISSPRNGLVSCGYREYYLDGTLVKKEALGTHSYKGQRGVKIVKDTGDERSLANRLILQASDGNNTDSVRTHISKAVGSCQYH